MGRAKLNMELITNEKTRNTTFKKRKQGLIRKMHEFTTLCDVGACMIIYGPNQESGPTEPEIWPQDRDEACRIIEVYRSKNRDSGNKTYGLSDFFHDRNRKIEEELSKQRKKNIEAKYPTWPEFMNFMPEARLRDFAADLSSKAERVRSRIELLRRNKQGLIMDYCNNYAPHPAGLDQSAVMNQMHVPNNYIHYPTIDHHHQNSSMMMLMMNGNNYSDHNNCVQFGGTGAANNCSSQFFYESNDPAMIWDGQQRPLGQYYRPTVPVPRPVPYVPMVAPPPPQLQFFKMETNNYDDCGDQEGVGGSQFQMDHNNIGRYYEY